MDMSEYIKSIETTWDEYHEFAVWLVNEMKPKVTVDIGVFHGFSTFSFALPRLGMVYAIDNFKIGGSFKKFVEHGEKLGVSNVHVMPMDFQEVEWKQRIDILHLDGDHSIEATRREFDKFSLYVNGGCILLHDVVNPAFEGPLQVFQKEIKNYYGILFEKNNGLGVLTKDIDLAGKICKEFNKNIVKTIDYKIKGNEIKVSISELKLNW